MKNSMYILALLAFLFCGCKESEIINSNDQFVGTWIVDIVDGKRVPTNNSGVITISADGGALLGNWVDAGANTFWKTEANILIVKDNKFVLSETGGKVNFEAKILLLSKSKFILDGPAGVKFEFRRAVDIYKKQFVGLWQGQCTTEGVPQILNRWDNKGDGSYVFFLQNAQGEWESTGVTTNKYYIYGNLLVTTWTDVPATGASTEHCDLWNITIDGDMMSYTATRVGNKVESYEMTRVK